MANVFLERCRELSDVSGAGVVQVVMPQNWLFLRGYKKQRESLLKSVSWDLLARLGPGAFETISGEVVQSVLLTQTNVQATADFLLRGIDASEPRSADEKADLLLVGHVKAVSQSALVHNPDSVVTLEALQSQILLGQYAVGLVGLLNGDSSRFEVEFWEVTDFGGMWEFEQSTVVETVEFGGRHKVVLWEGGNGQLRAFAAEARERLHDADRRGTPPGVGGGSGHPDEQVASYPIHWREVRRKRCCRLAKRGRGVLPVWAFGSPQSI